MSKIIHFPYICLIIASFIFGTLSKKEPEIVSIKTLTPVNNNFNHKEKLISEIDNTNNGSNSIICNEAELPIANLTSNPVNSKENQELTLASEKTEGLSRLFKQITSIELESISKNTLNDKTIYLQIEESLLINQFSEHDKIDYIEEYLIGHRKNVSAQFISDVMEQAAYMSNSEQIELLDIMRYQSLANRGANRDNFQKNITSGIISLANSADETVRLTALTALSTAAENDPLAKNYIKNFLSDTSELVRAHALVAQYKQSDSL